MLERGEPAVRAAQGIAHRAGPRDGGDGRRREPEDERERDERARDRERRAPAVRRGQRRQREERGGAAERVSGAEEAEAHVGSRVPVEARDVARARRERERGADAFDGLRGERDRVARREAEQHAAREREAHAGRHHALGTETIREAARRQRREEERDEERRREEAGLEVAEPEFGRNRRNERRVIGVRHAGRDGRDSDEADAHVAGAPPPHSSELHAASLGV